MNSTPLNDALPLAASLHRNVLIYDSLETDGRFLLYSFAAQLLKSGKKQRVLWLSGSPTTDRQIAAGLRKIGCDAATSYLRQNAATSSTNSDTLSIRSLAVEISDGLLAQEGTPWNPETYLKSVYRDIQIWAQQQQSKNSDDQSEDPSWLFLDDVSSLAALVGERLVYTFIEKIIAFSFRLTGKKMGVLIRCSGDLDQQLSQHKEKGSNNAELSLGWVGAGGGTHPDLKNSNDLDWIAWERSLAELVDCIIDVTPLASGYSREAHGRLVFTEVPGGRGWAEKSGDSHSYTATNIGGQVINYCLTDTGVRAIRLR